MKLQLRNSNIGIAVGTTIIFVGAYLFRNSSEGALEIVMLVALIAALGIANVLDEREERHSRSQ